MVHIVDCDIDVMTKVCAGFEQIHMCGNHGDPIYHPQFHQLIRQFKHTNQDVSLSMDTNGAFRSRQWWKITADLLTKKDKVNFSIDGMPHQNHIYRVNSRWDSVLDGIITLRENNPQITMVWKWIVFRYNQDDLEAGIELAKQLGFDRFRMVRSYRSSADDPLTSNRSFDELKERLRA